MTAVGSGAILSNYQRTRVENVCGRLGLTSLAYLWRRPQSPLLAEMVEAGLDAVLVKVSKTCPGWNCSTQQSSWNRSGEAGVASILSLLLVESCFLCGRGCGAE